MPNKKISEFNENLSPSGDNIIPIVGSGSTEYITLSALTSYITSGSTNLIMLDVNPSGATIDIVTHGTKTIVKVNTQLTGDTNFTCSDISNTKIGDVLVIITLTTSSIQFTFDSNYFLTTCNGNTTPSSFSPSSPRNVIYFTFDGEVWVNTFNNC
jgi:hypothetical protein